MTAHGSLTIRLDRPPAGARDVCACELVACTQGHVDHALLYGFDEIPPPPPVTPPGPESRPETALVQFKAAARIRVPARADVNAETVQVLRSASRAVVRSASARRAQRDGAREEMVGALPLMWTVIYAALLSLGGRASAPAPTTVGGALARSAAGEDEWMTLLLLIV